MTRRTKSTLPRLSLILTGLSIAPQLALAHVGFHDGSGFGTGMAHPIGGADHVVAMVAVGLWAAVSGGRAVWAMPAAFLTAMLVGGVLGQSGLPLPGVEPMILASIILLGAAAGLAWQPPLAPALAGFAVFGMAHGYAHGAEGVVEPSYAFGFLLSTAALHLLGLGIGFGLIRVGQGKTARRVGGGAAVAGLVLAFG